MDGGEVLRQVEVAGSGLSQCFHLQLQIYNNNSAQHFIRELEVCVSQLQRACKGVCPGIQLQLVKKVLEICKEGEVKGGQLLHTLGQYLGQLFKKTYSLLKYVLDRLVTDGMNGQLAGQLSDQSSQYRSMRPSVLSAGLLAGQPGAQSAEQSSGLLSGQPGAQSAEQSSGLLAGQSAGHSSEHLSGQSAPDLACLLLLIADIGTVSLHFDPAVLVLCWRSIGKLATAPPSSSPPPADASTNILSTCTVQILLKQLCVTMVTLTQQSRVPDDMVLEKRLKSGRFLSSLLLRLLGHYPEVTGGIVAVLVDLLLSTHQLVYQVQHQTLRPCLEDNLLLLRDPLVQHMCGNTEAARSFLQILLEDSSGHCGWAVCVCALLRYYPSLPGHLQDFCLESCSSREQALSSCRLIDAVFRCVQCCHEDLSVPFRIVAVVCDGRPQCPVSLYELLCCHLCVMCVCLSNLQLHHVEMNLFSHLLTDQSFSDVLASDILSFIARLGGDKVACRYCQLLTELCVLLPGSSTASSSNLLQARSLWARTMAMLPTQLQVSMLCGTSSSSMDNLLQLCANMDLSCLHAGVLDSVSSSVLPSSIQLLTAPRASASDVVLSVGCLCGVCEGFGDSCIVEGLGEHSGEVVSIMLNHLASSPTQYLLELSLRLATSLLPALPAPAVSQVLFQLCSLLCRQEQQQGSVCVWLAICHLLYHYAHIQFHHSYQSEGAGILARVYGNLLLHDHWLVQHQALVAFKRFAESSPYLSAVESCVPSPLTNLVLAYLKKVPHQEQVFTSKLKSCILLSHPVTYLNSTPLSCSPSTALLHTSISSHTINNHSPSSAAVQELELAWQQVVSNMKHLSSSDINQLCTLNSAIAQFCNRYIDQK